MTHGTPSVPVGTWQHHLTRVVGTIPRSPQPHFWRIAKGDCSWGRTSSTDPPHKVRSPSHGRPLASPTDTSVNLTPSSSSSSPCPCKACRYKGQRENKNLYGVCMYVCMYVCMHWFIFYMEVYSTTREIEEKEPNLIADYYFLNHLKRPKRDESLHILII